MAMCNSVLYVYQRVTSCHGRCRAPGCFVVFLVFFSVFWLICLMMAWVGVGWDVNVHVTFMMLR